MSDDCSAGDPRCQTWETWVKANPPQPEESAAIYAAADIMLDAPPDADGYPQMAAQALGIRLAAAGFPSLTIERAIEWVRRFGFLLERPERLGILRNTRLMGQVAAGRWAAVFGERPAKRENRETTTARGLPVMEATKKRRATKQDTALKTMAAITHKMKHPEATDADCATAADIPRSTLAARRDWREWSEMIAKAAVSGKLAKLKPEYDKKLGEIVATHE